VDATNLLRGARIVPVVVVDDPATAAPLAEVLFEAGLDAIEITLRTPGALKAIENIVAAFPDACVGAGSVRTAEQFVQIRDVGARFAVSPGSSELLREAAALNQMPFIPGAVTASEIIRLQEHGYALIKFFPAELAGGMQMLKALGSPLPEARFFPTGGITPALAVEYLQVPSVACIGGSWIAPGSLLVAEGFAAIARLARDAARLIA